MDPQVASIASSGNPTPGQSTIEQLMGVAGLNSPVQIPSQTVPVHQSSPNIPQATQLQDRQRVGPITGQVADVKRARRENAVGGVVNALNQATRQIEQRHIQQVTHDVTTVMNAQQQIDNATAVLQNPASSEQDKKNAQGVLDQNKKVMNGLFEDPKKRKSLQKAFDVSFTDPEKNNTPEIKAMQAAKTQFDKARAAGLDYNSPEEKKIGELANNPPQQQQQRQMITAGTNHSTTPYADQFLKSQVTGLAQNPAYAPAVKQATEQQKNATGIIKTELAQEHNDRRTSQTNQTRLDVAKAQEEAKAKVAETQAKERYEQAQMVIKGAMQRTLAAGQMATDRLLQGIKLRETMITKRETTPQQQEKLNIDIYKALNSANSQAVKDIDNLEKQKQLLDSKGLLHLKNKDGKVINDSTEQELNKLINDKKAELKANTAKISEVQARLSAGGSSNVGSAAVTSTTRAESRYIGTSKIEDGSSIGSDEDSDPDQYDQ